MSTKSYRVAVVGATGAVGREMVAILADRGFPVSELVPLASSRSAGEKIEFGGKHVTVRELGPDSFAGVRIALFSAGAKVSAEYAPIAAKAGAVVVDNTSHFRMDTDVPLIVPEVNPGAIAGYKARGIIANPNCSTIQMVLVLKPIHDAARIKRVVVSTYQSVSGAGHKAVTELAEQTTALFNQREYEPKVFPHRIAFNVIPQIDVFLEGGYTKEELKMMAETKKILGDDSVKVTATCVRVPVFYAHSEAINIETEKKLTAAQVRELLSKAPGVEVVDDPATKSYPLAIHAAGKDPSFVGRIREDPTITNGIDLWCVSDNVRKGAALNAVQIAEVLIAKYL
jgi:aspartate-semialdehyde dehydrogenase